MQNAAVPSGGALTPAGTSIFTMWKFCTHMKCEVKHNGDMGMGLIMGGAFMAYNGRSIYDLKVWLWLKWVGQLWQSKLPFRLEICSKMLVFRGVPFPIIAWLQVSVPLNSWPVTYYREGGTTPHLRLLLFVEPSSWLAFKVLWINSIAKQNVGGAKWVELFITLTKGMVEPMYGLLQSLITFWWSVWGLFSASCTEGSFAGYLGL